jgi:hypothetical protein
MLYWETLNFWRPKSKPQADAVLDTVAGYPSVVRTRMSVVT